jgi:hypothetical protein
MRLLHRMRTALKGSAGELRGRCLLKVENLQPRNWTKFLHSLETSVAITQVRGPRTSNRYCRWASAEQLDSWGRHLSVSRWGSCRGGKAAASCLWLGMHGRQSPALSP